MADLDADTVRHALAVARAKGFSRVRIGQGESVFEASLGEAEPLEELDGRDPEVQPEPSKGQMVTSPSVGYFSFAGKPVEVGTTVAADEAFGQVLALGIPNEVRFSEGGEIVEVLVTEGQPVEYGQALAKVGT